MKKIVIIVAAVVLLLIGLIFFFRARGGGSKGQAILKVTSTPVATIFLNDQKIGSTPYEDKVDAGEYTIKLISESSVSTSIPWEERITLFPNLLTYVNRELGESELQSAGEVLSLEKTSNNDANIAALSTPDGATISLNGEEKGTTPTIIEKVTPGNYDLTVSASGFHTRTVKVKATSGYKLTASFQLAASDSQPASSPVPSVSPGASSNPRVTPVATPRSTPRASAQSSATARPSPRASGSTSKASPPPKPYVEILDTPVGFLRVRSEPSTSAEEVGRVNPGEFYALLDEESSWYKIEYQDNKEGWVSGQYAEKSE